MYNKKEEGMKKVRKSKKSKKIKKSKKPVKMAKKKKYTRAKKVKKMKKPKRATKKKKGTRFKKTRRVAKVKKPKAVTIPKKPAPTPVPVQKVEYNQENATLCMCTKCPVQAESACARQKVALMEAMMQKGMPEGMMPPPEDIPGLYCATGVAVCKDLDTSKMCICTTCSVWEKCKLAEGMPQGYFCKDGKAK
jgi:hypothetical protein